MWPFKRRREPELTDAEVMAAFDAVRALAPVGPERWGDVLMFLARALYEPEGGAWARIDEAVGRGAGGPISRRADRPAGVASKN